MDTAETQPRETIAVLAEEMGAAARHDQLRGDLRDRGRRANPTGAPAGVRTALEAARFGTAPGSVLVRRRRGPRRTAGPGCVIDLDLAVDRDAKRAAQAIARASGRRWLSSCRCVRRLASRGLLTRSWPVDVVPLQGGSSQKLNLTEAELHGQRDGPAARGGRASRSLQQASKVYATAVFGWFRHDTFDEPLQAASCAWCALRRRSWAFEPEPSTFDAARLESPAIVLRRRRTDLAGLARQHRPGRLRAAFSTGSS